MVFHFIVFRLYSKLLKAVLLILKHATVLRQSKESKLALTEANLNYEKANIDSIIHQHFLECYPEDSKLVDFIMATEIGVFVSFFTTFSHQTFSIISVVMILLCWTSSFLTLSIFSPLSLLFSLYPLSALVQTLSAWPHFMTLHLTLKAMYQYPLCDTMHLAMYVIGCVPSTISI